MIKNIYCIYHHRLLRFASVCQTDANRPRADASFFNAANVNKRGQSRTSFQTSLSLLFNSKRMGWKISWYTKYNGCGQYDINFVRKTKTKTSTRIWLFFNQCKNEFQATVPWCFQVSNSEFRFRCGLSGKLSQSWYLTHRDCYWMFSECSTLIRQNCVVIIDAISS